jgi:multidrug resistance efflux pump
MIFGQLKMIITVIIIAGISGAGIYVMKLRADNATLKANQIKLEQAVESQQQVIAQQKKDFEDIMQANKQLNVLVQGLKKDFDDLDKRFNKGGRDLGKIAIERTDAIQRVVNKASEKAARCIELASGAKHTEAELKVTKKSEINTECPSIANPNYVPYE